MRFVLFFLMYSLGMVAYAAAQDTSVGLDSVFAPIKPYVAELMSLLIAAFMAWLVTWLRSLFKLQVEDKHRQALQSALENGAKMALEKLDASFAGKEINVHNEKLASGIEYVLKSVPDAVNYFGLTPERVAELLKPKLIPNANTIAVTTNVANKTE